MSSFFVLFEGAVRQRNRKGEMPNQLQFNFGEAKPPRSVHETLFFAVLPERETAPRLVETGQTLCQRYRVRGAVQPAGRLHVTLLGFRVD